MQCRSTRYGELAIDGPQLNERGKLANFQGDMTLRGELLGYVLRRIAHSVPLVIGVSIIAFGIMHLAPGGPLSVYTLNPTITAADLDRLRIALGLDQPLYMQYLGWVKSMLTGSWGYTLVRRPSRARRDPRAASGDAYADGHVAGARHGHRHAAWRARRRAAQFDLRLSRDHRRHACAVLPDILVRPDGDLHLRHRAALAALRRHVFLGEEGNPVDLLQAISSCRSWC